MQIILRCSPTYSKYEKCGLRQKEKKIGYSQAWWEQPEVGMFLCKIDLITLRVSVLSLHHVRFSIIPKVKHQPADLVVTQNDVLSRGSLQARHSSDDNPSSEHHITTLRISNAVWKTLLTTTSLAVKRSESNKQ